MNILLMLVILVINLIAVTIIYQFIKKQSKKDKIIFIAISFAIIYILVSITYWISGIGMDKKVNAVAKDFITYIFVPINVIIFIPFVASKYNKLKIKKATSKEFAKTIIKVSVAILIALVIECFYFKSIKQNISDLSMTMKSTLEQKNSNEETTNEILANTVNINNTENTNTNDKQSENIQNTNKIVIKNVVQ